MANPETITDWQYNQHDAYNLVLRWRAPKNVADIFQSTNMGKLFLISRRSFHDIKKTLIMALPSICTGGPRDFCKFTVKTMFPSFVITTIFRHGDSF